MYQIKNQERIALFGNSEKETYIRFLEKEGKGYFYETIYDTQLCITEETVNDIKVYSEEELCLDYNTIIVVGENWKYLSNRLFAKGLLPFRDFIIDWVLELYLNTTVLSYSNLKKYVSEKENKCLSDYIQFVSYHKKIATVYGNCQVPYIVRFLSRTKEFTDVYILLSIPPIHTLTEEKEKGFEKGVLGWVKLFIFQNIREDNIFSRKLSSTRIMELLSRGCKKVAIPNVFFKGYFPQLCSNPNNPFVGSKYNREGIFPYGDINIKSMLEEGMTSEEIFNCLKKENFYDTQRVREEVEKSIRELCEREKECDVVISDFIEKNYKKKRLFFVPNHPTNVVIRELSRRILSFLGYGQYAMNIQNIPENNNLEIPIYPSVAKGLGLEFDTDRVCFCRKFNQQSATFEGYIKAYEKYCKEKRENYEA